MKFSESVFIAAVIFKNGFMCVAHKLGVITAFLFIYLSSLQ